MKLAEVLKSIHKCEIPVLEHYSVLQQIKHEEFYYPATLIPVKDCPNNKIILLSAPGAVGKTALAKHIAYQYNGLYWDVSSSVLSSTAFAGEIAHAVGVGIGRGHLQDEFYEKLKDGKNMLVLDSFDEAALISRSDGIEDFLKEISHIMFDAKAPSIIMTARTEMANFICDICDQVGLEISCYSIDYFEEAESARFITGYLKYKNIPLNAKQEQHIQQYIRDIKDYIGKENDPKTFIGYAQVLSILSRQIEVELETSSDLDGLSSYIGMRSDKQLIYSIIQHLLSREQKKLDHYKAAIRDKYVALGKESVVDRLYDKEEQLIRLQFYVGTGGIALDDVSNCTELLPEDQGEYAKLINDWLPQHVFLHDKQVMPIFSDYLLAESLLNSNLSMFSDEYKRKLPTRVFLDCYLSLSNNCVSSKHIYYLDLAFSSQTAIDSTAYCEINSMDDGGEESTEDENLALYLTMTTEGETRSAPIFAKILRDGNAPICLCRAENMSVSVDGKVVLAPTSFLHEVTIRKSMIECDELVLDTPKIVFETYGDEKNCIIVHKSITRQPAGKIILRGTENLQISLPTENLGDYKREFHEFLPYIHSITLDNESTDSCDDIEQFTYALKKVLEQFKVDRYDGDAAKYKEKIDARCHTGCKARVLAFLKDCDLIYEDNFVYKASLKKMDSMKISRVAYSHFDFAKMEYAYEMYEKWFAENLIHS